MTAILSEVLIKNNRLLLTLKDLGSVYVHWQHPFASNILSPQEREHVKTAFSDYAPQPFDRIPKFNILQITGPVDLADRLNPEHKTLFDDHFVTGHYTPVARWRVGVPWWAADVDPRVLEILEHKRHHDAALTYELEQLTTALQHSDRAKKRGITRFEDYIATHWDKLASVLDETTVTRAHQLVDEHQHTLEQLVSKNFPAAAVERNLTDKAFDIILDSHEYIKPTRSLTAEEILHNSKLYIFDIEKPLFETPEEEVSWIASVIVDKGTIVRKSIKTLRDPGITRHHDWLVERYASEGALVDAVRREIITPDDRNKTIDAIIAYNAPYDIEHTEEAGDFLIGERESDPKVEVALDFFRKLKIHGRLILDPLPPARIRFRHLPNRKFELILAESLGIHSSKLVNYDQLAQLERVAKDNNAQHLSSNTITLIAREYGLQQEQVRSLPDLDKLCAQLELRYVAADVDNLHKLLFSDWFKEAITDATWLSNTYKVELSRILHSTKTINDAQERNYFSFVGTHRDIIYQKFKKMIQLQQQGRQRVYDRISTWLCAHSERGIHENVHKVYLPIGLWFAPHVAGGPTQARFPEITKLVDYAHDHRANKHRYFTLVQYLNALADYILVDFGLYAKTRSEFEQTLKQHGMTPAEFRLFHNQLSTDSPLEHKLKERTIPPVAFQRVYAHFSDVMQHESEWGYKHLVRGTLTECGVAKHADDRIIDFCSTYNVTAVQFAELLKLKAHDRKQFSQQKLEQRLDAHPILEKHHLSFEQLKKLLDLAAKLDKRENKIAGQYNTTVTAIRETLNEKLDEVKRFCETNHSTIIHAQGGFLYLAGGNAAALQHPDAPVIVVDEIPKAYVAINPVDVGRRMLESEHDHKIYYPTHNYFEGIKVTDRPTTTLTQFEMRCYAPLLELILDGEHEEALHHANTCLDQLRESLTAKQAEVTMFQDLLPRQHVDTDTYEAHLTIPKRDLVWYAKKPQQYRGFEHGQLTRFVVDASHAEGRELQTDEATGRTYFVEPARKNSEKERIVYVMPLEHFQPDIAQYYERIKNRVRDLIEPITGFHESFDFVKKSHHDVSKFLKRDPVEQMLLFFGPGRSAS